MSAIYEMGLNKISRSGLDVAFGEGHGNMISLVHKNVVILIIFTGGGIVSRIEGRQHEKQCGENHNFPVSWVRKNDIGWEMSGEEQKNGVKPHAI